MKLQTRKRTYRAICFDPVLHDQLNSKYESSSPIQIENCQLKVNPRSNDQDIIINKRSRLIEPNEIDFDINLKEREPAYKNTLISLSEVRTIQPGTPLDVFGRISFKNEPQIVNVRGSDVKMQEAVITDETATVRLVLWESDISKVISGETYDLKRVVIKDYSRENYISLNKQTEIIKSHVTVDRRDDDITGKTVQSCTVACPADGVLSIHRYFLCKKCSKLIVAHDEKLVKCGGCGLFQLKLTSQPEVQANAFFCTIGERKRVAILLRQNVLEKLFNLFNCQSDKKHNLEFENLSDEDLMEIIVSVSKCTICCSNNIAQAVVPD